MSLIVCQYLSACNLPSEEINGGQEVEMILTEMSADLIASQTVTEAIPDPTATAIPVATAEPERALNICLGSEPQSLFIYANASQSMWSVLEAIYDGPFDTINGEDVPVIFEEVIIDSQNVTVEKGMVVANARGEAISIAAGDQIIPTNGEELCGTSGCTLEWDEKQEAALTQVTITFRLKDGLKWSDGEPLTVYDSIFSFELNNQNENLSSKRLVFLTASYTAENDLEIIWRGIPGYSPQKPSNVFWLPLPKHSMEGMRYSDLLTNDNINKQPLGWGAYQISSWNEGQQIELSRNPYYSKADGSLPYFNKIVYKFFGESGDNNIAALRNGDCDIVDTSVDFMVDLEPILEDVRDKKLSVYIQPELTWEHLTMNFVPAYYNNFSPSAGNGLLYANQSVRQAMLQCIDRKQLIRDVFYGQSEVPVGFYPAQHLYAPANSDAIPYDPAAAAAALEAAGWLDSDKNPATPRINNGLQQIAYGQPLNIEILTSDSITREKTAAFIQKSLGQCGFGVNILSQPLDAFYASAPDGSLFNRSFDLAQFAWSSDDRLPCTLYTSEQIPADDNRKIGVNVGAYSDEVYDQLCHTATASTIADPQRGAKYQEIQNYFSQQIPAIPLYFNFSIGLSQNKICGVQDAIGSRSMLWNIEDLSASETDCAISQWHNIYE